MKRLIQLLAIVSVVGVMALLVGCQKENWVKKGSAKEVKFGATAHSSVDTRTEYMDYNGTAENQKIKWLGTDRIRIYSPDAARRVAVEAGENPSNYYYWADYQVVPTSDPTKGTLTNLSNDIPSVSDGGNGLVWLSETATFYGVYPIPSGKNGTGSSVADGKFDFHIPNSQSFSVKGDMSYAFMTAKTSSVKEGESVTLNFYPDFTAFEISLKCGESESEVKLKSFEIGTTAKDHTGNLAGSYTVDLSGAKSYTLPDDGSSYGKTITVNMSSSPKAIPSGDADPLVFTVFAVPDNLSNLYVKFTTTTDGSERTWRLALNKNGSPITFGACKKHRIYGLQLPTEEWKITYAEAGMVVEEWTIGNDQTFVVE